LIAVLLIAGLLLLAGCGAAESPKPEASTATPTAAETATPEPHDIAVTYDEPKSRTDARARQILKLGGTDGVAAGFSKNFAFPVDLTIHAQAGEDSPYYDPSTKTVNLFYGFVTTTADILRAAQPRISDTEFGTQWAAVDAFILIHELGHAFVDVFELPITGREEDAVDGLATTFLTDSVVGGERYAFDAARFFSFLQEVQGAPTMRQFQDEHSLSVQRSYDILCSVAGSSEATMQEIAELGILPRRRLARCPAEYEQKSRAWKTLLKPHLRSSQ
jgi:hypothetical protein